MEESVASRLMDGSYGRELRIGYTAVGDLEVDANAEVDCSIDCENYNDLPEGWKVTRSFLGDAVRFYASRLLDKSIATGRLVQILTYFFNCYRMWIPWVNLTRYPGECFPGDFVSYRCYTLI